MSSPQDAVKRVVEAFERSQWSEIDVRTDRLRVHLKSTAPTMTPDAAAPVAAMTETGDAAEARASLSNPPPTGAHVVVSPSPGILWRSPEPGLPPFADLGHIVDASATVCIIEVMKLMNHVKAGVSGEVIAVYGDNGVAVKKGQALFAIAPSGSSA